MKTKIRLHIALLFLCFLSKATAQDAVFTQFMLVPETINPAFTGIANAWNAGIMNRRQWPNGDRRIDSQYGYVNNMVTDQFALGGNILNQHERFTNYNYTQVNASASYRIELNYDWRLRFGLEGGYGRKSYNFNNLLLEDQINTNNGSISSGSIDPGVLNIGNHIDFVDFSGGIVLDKEDAWFGITLKHLNQPDISFTEFGNVPLEMFVSIHGGYYLTIDRPGLSIIPDGSDVFFTFNYMRQAQYNRLDIGAVIDMPTFSFGVIAATNPESKTSNSHLITSVNPVLSMKSGEFTFGYSYDLNTSRMGRTQGVHELSLTWQSNYTCSSCDNYKVKLKRNGESGYTR